MRKVVAATAGAKRDPNDPRVKHTRTNLLAAFNRLFLEHGYEAITPGMIAAKAGVGRSTFYEHHAGKEALLRHSITPLLQPLAQAAIGCRSPALANVLRHLWENRRIAARLLLDRPGRIIRDQLAGLVAHGLMANGSSSPISIPLLATGLAAAQLALIEAWLGGRHACTPDQLALALMSGLSPARR